MRTRYFVWHYRRPLGGGGLQESAVTRCGNLAQGDGLVILMSQAPVTSAPRTHLRGSRTIEIITFGWESVVYSECSALNYNNLLMWGRYPPIDTSSHNGNSLENRHNEDHHRAAEHTYSSHWCKWTHSGMASCHMWWAWNSRSTDPWTRRYSYNQTCPSHWCTFRHVGMGWKYIRQYQHHICQKEHNKLHLFIYY
jgi:hypothetical protein